MIVAGYPGPSSSECKRMHGLHYLGDVEKAGGRERDAKRIRGSGLSRSVADHGIGKGRINAITMKTSAMRARRMKREGDAWNEALDSSEENAEEF